MASQESSDIRDARGEAVDVVELLQALKLGVGARAVGVYDDDLGRLHASSEPSAEAFWSEGVAVHRCLLQKVDWDGWYRELCWAKHRREQCDCAGQHALHGLFIHGRWSLLVVTVGAVPSVAPALMMSVALLLSRHLPRARHPRRRGGRGPEHARVGIPLRWLLDLKPPRAK
jgi:hypothetical protein